MWLDYCFPGQYRCSAYRRGKCFVRPVFQHSPRLYSIQFLLISVVDLKTNSVIGSPLISWTDYASVSHAIPANNTQFSVTLPSSLPSDCATAGNCALQWWWDARSIDQTYMAYVKFI